MNTLVESCFKLSTKLLRNDLQKARQKEPVNGGYLNFLKLRYRSTTINNRSDHGRMLYQQNKRLALLDMRENIPRPLYKSKYTKKFLRFLKLCSKSGLFNQVKDAQTTMEAIKTF